jgi:ABC-2 type transport system permease protein
VIFIVVGLIGAAGLLGDTVRKVAGWTPVGALTNLYAAAAGTASWGSDQWIGLAMSVVYAVVCGVIGVRWFRWTVR